MADISNSEAKTLEMSTMVKGANSTERVMSSETKTMKVASSNKVLFKKSLHTVVSFLIDSDLFAYS